MTKRLNDDPDHPTEPAQMNLGNVVTNLPAVRAAKKVNTLSRVHRRLIEPIETDQDNGAKLAYQHTVFCQTGFPYRNPGDDIRLWTRRQGNTALEVQAGRLPNPATREYTDIGLPWGAKPRLILAHLNAEALRKQSAAIEIESSLSAFVKRIRGFQHGREIRAFKDQLGRLSASTVRLALFRENVAHAVETKVITSFDLWLHKDERQRVLWPSTIQLSLDYFNTLLEHAVPLHEADLAALAHSALALDLYAWLAQRLHRINPNRPTFIQWPAIKQQFGPDYGRMSNFKPEFRKALRQVLTRYKAARIEEDECGIRLRHSPPPVSKRLVMLPRSKSASES